VWSLLKNPGRFISPDVLTEETRQGPFIYYRVRIRITGYEFKGDKAHEIHIRPGLTASVEIKAMERTVLNYLTKPIAKTFSQSMGERKTGTVFPYLCDI
jgi:adhesin transport system membrane fusion protein